jgi:hypothetical protein
MKRRAVPLVVLIAGALLLFGQADGKSPSAKEPAKGSKEEQAGDALTLTVITRTGKRNRHARALKLKVFVVINGDTGHKTRLNNRNRDEFELGATDTFKDIPIKLPLEEIETIRLAVEGDDMWHCESISFQFSQKDQKSRLYKFHPDRYLSGAKEKTGFNATRLIDFKLKPAPELTAPDTIAEEEKSDEASKKDAKKTKK